MRPESIGEGRGGTAVGAPDRPSTRSAATVAGGLVPDSGTLRTPAVAPVPDVLARTGDVGDYLDAVTAPLRSMTARFETITARLASRPDDNALTRDYDELLAAMTAADAWNLDIRIASVLAGLGLGGLAEAPARSREPASLSPGQRGRLALAAALIARPAALVLDEPTNHLDDGAIAFLSETLHGWEGPILLASHDRAFIDDIATCVLDFDTAPWQALLTASGGGRVPGVQRCAGAYTDYLEDKARARASHERIHASQQEDKRSLRAHRCESETIGHYGTARHHGARTEIRASRKFYADRASSASTRRRRIDEPTNYLDLDTTEALEAALATWNGTLLVASHDRWLVAHWSGPRLRLTSAPQDHRPMTRADEPRMQPRRGDVHETRTRIG